MSADPRPLAVSIGDPAGIGPELIAACWARRKEASLGPFFVAGGFDVLGAAAKVSGSDCPLIAIGNVDEALDAFAEGLPVLVGEDCDYTPAKPDDAGAALAMHSLAEATRHALLGNAAGVVTAPVSKAQLARVGFEFPGQTEFLAEVCGLAQDDAVMMLAGPTLRTVPLTVHVAIADVPGLLSSDLIIRKARITATALTRDFGIDRPRLAIAGLNPHAGEGGKFGDEEARVIQPAIDALAEEGLDVSGPHSADAMFTPHGREGFDAALCMYHDQALIPIKALEFEEGVNVTLGLPIIRTSPDHGTAFDIAGKGIADPGAMIAAVRVAGKCAEKRAAAAQNA